MSAKIFYSLKSWLTIYRSFRAHRQIAVAALFLLLALLIVAVPATAVTNREPNEVSHNLPPGWWKGNLHAHTLWSDGNAYPETVVDWYKNHGYHFLSLSDHNILSKGQKWIDPNMSIYGENCLPALGIYKNRFGNDWVEQKTEGDKLMVRLKPLEEFRHLFEEPGKFILIPAEEISDGFSGSPIHLNAINLQDYIEPQKGNSIFEVMQKNVDATLEQKQKTGQLMFPMVNHPNFFIVYHVKDPNMLPITAEDIAKVKGLRFFEIYNGSSIVYNNGDGDYISTERMWDIILTVRLSQADGEVIYGMATDDAHDYRNFSPDRTNPGKAFNMVRASHLTPESIIRAMEAGDFYSSTGVILRDIRLDCNTIRIEIEPQENVSYTTYFIGTTKDYDRTVETIEDANSVLPARHVYSDDIGRVLGEVKGLSPAYILSGQELYVRATIVSSREKINTFDGKPDVEKAWVQPIVPGDK